MASDRADSEVAALISPAKTCSIAQKMLLAVAERSDTHVPGLLLGERNRVVAALSEGFGDGVALIFDGVHQ